MIRDDRCTRHDATGDDESERVMHRVTVLGDYAQPDAPSPWPTHDTGRLSAQSSFSIFRCSIGRRADTGCERGMRARPRLLRSP